MSDRPHVLVFDQAPGFYMDAMCGGVQDADMVPVAFDNPEAARDELDETFTAVVATMPPTGAVEDGSRLIGARPVLLKAQQLERPAALFTDMHGQALIGRRGSQDKYFNHWPMENSDVRQKVASWLGTLGASQPSESAIELSQPGKLTLPLSSQAEQIGRLVFGSEARMQIGLWIAEQEVGTGFLQQDVADATGISAGVVSGQIQNFRQLGMVERGWHSTHFRLNRRIETPLWGIFDMTDLVLETIASEPDN